jgi:glyoxylase-like metal-dependent hydrolase (beta-lactamase superfamily II)
VDAQPSVAAARELLAAIAERADAPVRYLVLTHPHAESCGGVPAFPADALIVASEGAVDSLGDDSFDYAAEMPSLAGDAWTEPGRPRPTLVVLGQARLDDARNPVLLSAIGSKHSPGDLVVDVTAADVVHAGGLLFHAHRDPFLGGGTAKQWLVGLNQLFRRNPAAAVATRGAVVSAEAIRDQRDSLAWLKGRVDEAFVDRIPMGEIRAAVEGHENFTKHFAGGGEASLVKTLVDGMIEELADERRKRGLL